MGDQQKINVVLGVPRQRTLINAEGLAVLKIEQPYSIGDATYTILVNKEGSTKESIEKAVIEDAQKIKGLSGSILQI